MLNYQRENIAKVVTSLMGLVGTAWEVTLW